MKKECMFEVIGMLQMAIKAFEASKKNPNELEKNALEMVKESEKLLTQAIMDKLAVSEHRQGYSS